MVLASMLCPLGKHVAGTQLSEQKKTRPVSLTSKNETSKKIGSFIIGISINISFHALVL